MKQQGLSLIDLLLASCLSCLLILIVSKWLIYYNQQNQLTSAFMELEENAQFAEHLLKQNFQSAGFVGCRNLQDLFIINPAHNELKMDANHAITVNDEASPILCVQQVDHLLTPILAVPSKTEIVIPSKAEFFNSADLIILTNCQTTELNRIHSISNEQGRVKLTLSYPLRSSDLLNGWISKVHQDCFFLAKSRLIKNIFSLYKENVNHECFDLVPGIVAWQIEGFFHGQWLLAKFISDWSQVEALRIHLLLRSKKQVLTKSANYRYLGENKIADDRYLYREFIFFIPLLERTL